MILTISLLPLSLFSMHTTQRHQQESPELCMQNVISTSTKTAWYRFIKKMIQNEQGSTLY